MDAFRDWRHALAGRKDAAFKSYPKLDHGFPEGEGPGQPSDYAARRNVAPYVVADIAAWIKRHRSAPRPRPRALDNFRRTPGRGCDIESRALAAESAAARPRPDAVVKPIRERSHATRPAPRPPGRFPPTRERSSPPMFGSTVLEVAIGMIFVYLLMSLLCSAVNEYIELKLQHRSKNLWRGIQLLLNGEINERKERPDMIAAGPGVAPPPPPPGQTPPKLDIASELYQHGLVRALFRDERSLPSYIPSRTFALALWNLASRRAGEMAAPSSPPAAAAGFTAADLKKIREVIDQLPNKELAQALGTLIDEAKGDFNKALKNVEDWYDGAMDRVSGWYKRRVQKHLIVIGCVAALLVNADSVNIAKSLIQDKALRDVVVASADDYLREQSAANAGAGGARPAASSPSVSPAPADPEAKIRQVRQQLYDLGLPIGWAFDKSYTQDPRGVPRGGEGKLATAGWLLLKLFGLFMTGLAISQGAPFWFDLLNKFMVIRSTVKPKEKSQEQPSKDKPAPETEVGGDDAGGKG
ncbi:MAG: hypothetical protein LC800_03480 [Acidobacteria bacterium]|nr:hypothetical protein [Acidobacteriota bacterium]